MPELGQLLWVTPASWLEAPKRRRRSRRTSLSLALREGKVGATPVVGQVACAKLLVANCPPQEALVLPPRGFGKGQVVAQFPCYFGHSFSDVPERRNERRGNFACHLMAKVIVLSTFMKLFLPSLKF